VGRPVQLTDVYYDLPELLYYNNLPNHLQTKKIY